MSLPIPVPLETSASRRLIGAYAELPVISGRSFLLISFLGRLPTAMVPLAILTFAASSTGSYSVAGLAAAVTAAGTAVGAPLMGRLADQRGQRPVLCAAVLLNALALIAIALPPLSPESPHLGLLALCLLAGLSMPSIGGMARARWLAMTRQHAGTAMAFEGTADEIAYVLGPALVGILATGLGARCALLVAAVAGLLTGGAFAQHRTHRATVPWPESRAGERTKNDAPANDLLADDGTRRIRLLRAVLTPVLAMTLMGAFFAAIQCAVNVSAARAGLPSSGGLIYALMALGSAPAAFATTAVPKRFGPRQRCTFAAGGLLAGALMMTDVRSVPMLCGAILITGLAVGPMLVTFNQIAGAASPIARVATAMSYLSAGSVIGITVGATAAGALADASGSRGAFSVAVAASALLLPLCLIGLREV